MFLSPTHDLLVVVLVVVGTVAAPSLRQAAAVGQGAARPTGSPSSQADGELPGQQR